MSFNPQYSTVLQVYFSLIIFYSHRRGHLYANEIKCHACPLPDRDLPEFFGTHNFTFMILLFFKIIYLFR